MTKEELIKEAEAHLGCVRNKNCDGTGDCHNCKYFGELTATKLIEEMKNYILKEEK